MYYRLALEGYKRHKFEDEVNAITIELKQLERFVNKESSNI